MTVAISGSGAQIQNTSYDSITNTTYFTINVPQTIGANHGFLYMTFSATRRAPSSPPNSGISALKVMRPGYSLTTNKIFTDEYIALLKAADFACYRFYGVQNVWDAEPTYPAVSPWNMRKTPNDACRRYIPEQWLDSFSLHACNEELNK